MLNYPHSPSDDIGITYNFFLLNILGFLNKTIIDFDINGFVIKLSSNSKIILKMHLVVIEILPISPSNNPNPNKTSKI